MNERIRWRTIGVEEVSLTGAKFVEAAWAGETRVPRNSLGCRLQGVLSLHRLWVNANLRGGQET